MNEERVGIPDEAQPRILVHLPSRLPDVDGFSKATVLLEYRNREGSHLCRWNFGKPTAFQAGVAFVVLLLRTAERGATFESCQLSGGPYQAVEQARRGGRLLSRFDNLLEFDRDFKECRIDTALVAAPSPGLAIEIHRWSNPTSRGTCTPHCRRVSNTRAVAEELERWWSDRQQRSDKAVWGPPWATSVASAVVPAPKPVESESDPGDDPFRKLHEEIVIFLRDCPTACDAIGKQCEGSSTDPGDVAAKLRTLPLVECVNVLLKARKAIKRQRFPPLTTPDRVGTIEALREIGFRVVVTQFDHVKVDTAIRAIGDGGAVIPVHTELPLIVELIVASSEKRAANLIQVDQDYLVGHSFKGQLVWSRGPADSRSTPKGWRVEGSDVSGVALLPVLERHLHEQSGLSRQERKKAVTGVLELSAMLEERWYVCFLSQGLAESEHASCLRELREVAKVLQHLPIFVLRSDTSVGNGSDDGSDSLLAQALGELLADPPVGS